MHILINNGLKTFLNELKIIMIVVVNKDLNFGQI